MHLNIFTLNILKDCLQLYITMQYNKQYQNVSFSELMAYAKINPNRNLALTPIEIKVTKSAEDTSLDKIGLRGYTAMNLNPGGILGVLICINDDNYAISTKATRAINTSELATELQEKTDTLKNTHLSRKRKKIYDLISTSFNNEYISDDDLVILYEGVSYLTNKNFVLIKTATQDAIENGDDTHIDTRFKGDLMFSSNPSKWKYDTPIYFIDYRARWIAQNPEHSNKNIGEWLSDCETSGWLVHWPEVDSTKTEIVNILSDTVTWKASDKSLKKEVLAQRLGKLNTINTFVSWVTHKFDLLESTK